MSLNTEPAYQDILSKLKTLTGVTLLEVEDDDQVKRKGSEVVPYVIFSLGGPVRSSRDRGIAESARDTNQMWANLTCVSTNNAVARKLKNDVVTLLTDYVPSDSGRMTLEGGLQYPIASTTTMPKRYAHYLTMAFAHNMQV